jgi:hypothetical protein
MNAMQSMTDDKIIKAACALMRSGQATQGDIGRLAGVDRQLVRYWAQRAGIDAPAARAAYLDRLWQRRVQRLSP